MKDACTYLIWVGMVFDTELGLDQGRQNRALLNALSCTQGGTIVLVI